MSVSKSNNGTPRTATYRITPAGGKIVHADNGTYNVNVVAGTVKDTRGNAVAAGLVGTFVFNVP